jgi:hypothetical protein
MKITQVFRSSNDERLISEIEIGGADHATPIPITGDNVRWIVKGVGCEGRVPAEGCSRLSEVVFTTESQPANSRSDF